MDSAFPTGWTCRRVAETLATLGWKTKLYEVEPVRLIRPA